ncbi:Card1-like endonuclease domain-containing protein [Alloiococcus sp. CFN-8]|uniref:Card1-like endonuclease domain-containing protein n=1 Tax=Alloiococcus sp. CFN-8 TaxID=3416081 RepID=UPI003CEF3387
MELGKVENLLCFFHEFNSGSIYTILNIKPRKVIFIIERDKAFHEDYDNVRGYLTKRIPEVAIDSIMLTEPIYQKLEGVFKEFSPKDTVISLSSGSRLVALMAYKLSLDYGYKAVYGDVEREGLFILTDRGPAVFNRAEEELKIKDIIASAGGKSLEDSSRFYEDKKIEGMMDYITTNYTKWKGLKQIFRSREHIEYNDFRPLRVNIKKQGLNYFEAYRDFFTLGEALGIFYYKDHGERLSIDFINMGYKSFIFKVGTWLEILTYSMVKRLKEIDEVKAGVVFLWDIDKDRIKNEVDVLASAGSRLIYISCKDTANYDEGDLNELEVYSNKIGGEEALKILVATSLPNKNTTVLRAEEMGIHIIIFNGDMEGFKRNLQRLMK